MKTPSRFLGLASAVWLAATLTLQAGPALVGNSGLSGQTLDADGVKAVLMGKKATIGDARVVIVIAKSGDNQEQFLKDHLGMTTSQFQTYWRRLYMTGGGSAPKTVGSEDEARKLVAETPGAIAVVDAANTDGLTVLMGN